MQEEDLPSIEAATFNPQKERNRFFYGDRDLPLVTPLVEKRIDEINKALEKREVLAPITVGDGRVLSSSEEYAAFITEIFTSTEVEYIEQAAADFWSFLEPEYITLLDTLSSQIAPQIQTADLVISIAARNELEIDEAIDRFIHSNPTLLEEKKVVFVVNDNFQKRDIESGVREKVIHHLHSLHREDVEVVTVSVELPEFSNAGMAKKVGMEAILRAMCTNQRFVPVQSLDADTKGYLEPNYMVQALAELNKGTTLAVTSRYEFDPEFLHTYPAWEFRTALAKNIMRGVSWRSLPPLVGSSFLIHPLTYFLVNGYKPLPSEDKKLARDIRNVYNLHLMGYETIDPIKAANTVFISPVKEMHNIEAGLLPESHWLEGNAQTRSNDLLKEYRDPEVAQELLNTELTATGVKEALKSVHELLLRLFKTSSELYSQNQASFQLISALKWFPDVHVFLDSIVITFRDQQAFLKRAGLPDNTPLLEKINYILNAYDANLTPAIEEIKVLPEKKIKFNLDAAKLLFAKIKNSL